MKRLILWTLLVAILAVGFFGLPTAVVDTAGFIDIEPWSQQLAGFIDIEPWSVETIAGFIDVEPWSVEIAGFIDIEPWSVEIGDSLDDGTGDVEFPWMRGNGKGPKIVPPGLA